MINPRSGDILKMAETSYEFNSACAPLVTDKYLVVSTSNKGVVAFDRLTFKEVWNYRTGTSLSILSLILIAMNAQSKFRLYLWEQPFSLGPVTGICMPLTWTQAPIVGNVLWELRYSRVWQ